MEAKDISGLLVLGVFGAIVLVAIFRKQIWDAKPGYASRDELRALQCVMAGASASLGKDDPRRRSLSMLHIRLNYPSIFGGALNAEQVGLVMPFAEQWLSGELPHFLSEEYDDEVRIPLLRYKERLASNGLWPR
jgi:hypothetical protein